MKKIIALSSILLGIIFLTGCSLQPLKKTQPTTSAPIVEQPIATTTPQIDETADWKTYTDSKIGFTFKYPADVNISSDNKKDSGLMVGVYIDNLDTMEDAPLGYDKASALKDKTALANGDPSGLPGRGNLKMLNIPSALAKEFVTFQEIEICNVQFDHAAMIYKDNYRIQLHLTYNGSAIQNNNPSYFKTDSKNCGSDKIWGDSGAFYKDLVAGKTDSVSQNWFTIFDKIISTFKFTEQSTTTYTTKPLAECKGCENGQTSDNKPCCTASFEKDCASKNGVVRFSDLHPAPGVLKGCFPKAPDTGKECASGKDCLSGVCDLESAIKSNKCALIKKELTGGKNQYGKEEFYTASYSCGTTKPGACTETILNNTNPSGIKHTFEMNNETLIEILESGPIS